MSIDLKDNNYWSLLVPTSMGVRLSPDNGQPVHASNRFLMQVTSAESNVASISSYLGLPVKLLTTFVKDSPVSRIIKDNLSSRHISVEGPDIEQGGPWGYRHQFNIADSGYGNRGPVVHNDRAGEVGKLLSADYFDLKRIFRDEGVKIVHISGLIASLSPETGQFCLELIRYAKRYGSRISFDLNYRASFWMNRESELRKIFHEIALESDILIGNEEDFQLCFGIDGPEAGGDEIRNKIDGFKMMIERIREEFPKTQIFATTLRQVISSNSHLWGSIMLADNEYHIIEPRKIGVIDRIGGGDGFVGGLLYGLLNGWSPEKSIQFGWGSGALAATMLTDYAQPATEEQIWSLWMGNARVKR